MLTPSLSISSTYSQGTVDDQGGFLGFETGKTGWGTRFKVPNFGFITTYNTRNSSGLKRLSFGIVGNATNDYTNGIKAIGTNSRTTLAGGLATLADGWPESTLGGSFYSDDIPSWMTMVGYQSGIVSPVNGSDNAYAGATERVLDNGDIKLADRINQRYQQRRRGNKYDILMNFAADFSDKFYLGANLGITSLSYRQDVAMAEEPVDPDSFVSTYIAEDGTATERHFNSLRMRTAYRAEGTGIYAKAGFIWRPVAGLRVGAAIQTPSILEIEERYAVDGRSVIDGRARTAQSPEDEWHYNLKTPSRFNAGVAYTVGSMGLVSFDYERCNYQAMDLRSSMYDNNADFSVANRDIYDCMRASHAFRVGAELKPMPSLAIRVGYNYVSSPLSSAVMNYKDGARERVSFGLGYSSGGSFFADAAVRFHWMPIEYITPYYYYLHDDEGDFINADIPTPQISADTRLVDVLMTVGWRF